MQAASVRTPVRTMKNVFSFSVVRYGTGRHITGHCEKKHYTCNRSNTSTTSNIVIQVETVVKQMVYFTYIS